MRTVAVTRVLNEADVVETFVRHTAAHVDHHILLDNGSLDGTPDILLQLKAEGFNITLLKTSVPFHNEEKSNEFMFRSAVVKHGADWVSFLDADEFIDIKQTGADFPSILDQVKSDIPCVRVFMANYVATNTDEAFERLVTNRIRFRRAVSNVPKVILRASLLNRDVRIGNGNHGAYVDGGRACPWHDEHSLHLAHFPERSKPQAIAKYARGWARALAAGSRCTGAGTSGHYRVPFEMLRDQPDRLINHSDFAVVNSTQNLIHDPVSYRGGALRYTPDINEPMRAIQTFVGYVETLARHHGRLLDECPEARAVSAQWANEYVRAETT